MVLAFILETGPGSSHISHHEANPRSRVTVTASLAMPPSKKQKTNSGSSIATLRRFFDGHGSKSKKSPMSLSTKNLSRSCPADREIIVIDSDDDEIEIVEEPNDSHPQTSTTNRKLVPNGCTAQRSNVVLLQMSKNMASDAVDEVSSSIYPSFGFPVLLQPQRQDFIAELITENSINADAHVCNKMTDNAEVPPEGDGEPLYMDSPRLSRMDNFAPWDTGDDEMMNPVSTREEDDEYFENEDSSLEPYTNLEAEGPRPSLSGSSLIPSHDSSNAFSVLMSSFRENESWKEASKMEDRSIRPSKNNRRKAPFYKVLQGMPIAVDAFRYGTIPDVTAYFLTHAHADHYTNLSSSWKSGPIYCSEGTANLIFQMLSVDKKWVHPLPMDVPTVIPNTGGVCVTLIEANHCPGSCLFLFEGPQTVHTGDSKYKSPFIGSLKVFRYLHCGDFRASPRHVLHPAMKGKQMDHVYLDTTYLDPKYTFPPQPLVISACAKLAKQISQGTLMNKSGIDTWLTKKDCEQRRTGRTLFIVGTYSVGKERVLKAIAHALESKVYCDARKAALLRCEADDELNNLLTSNPLAADVHLLPLGMITSDRLRDYLQKYKGQFDKAVGFRPTGWTYTHAVGIDQTPTIATVLSRVPHRDYTYLDLRPSRQSTKNLQIYPVPYSEHSSFFELTCFAMSFNWAKMIATVNVGSDSSRQRMARWFSRWEMEKKRGSAAIVPYRHPDYW
ncbi:hypothetical protein AX15_006449 [Amanita polypyramis BW_CC]|nr:hypothetical protein AX15_006449 [Amanita polypyramis BW_CC]